MTRTGNEKKYASIAAICYTICALWIVYIIIIDIIDQFFFIDAQSIWQISHCIAWLAMAVTLFMNNRKAVIFATGALVLLCTYGVICWFGMNELCRFLSYSGAATLIVLSLKENRIVKKIWFLPACVMLFGCINSWIFVVSFGFSILTVLRDTIEITAVLFTGIWLKKNDIHTEEERVIECTTVNSHGAHSVAAASIAINDADKLKMYKDLLDSGIITQEEFDAKKKQILDL